MDLSQPYSKIKPSRKSKEILRRKLSSLSKNLPQVNTIEMRNNLDFNDLFNLNLREMNEELYSNQAKLNSEEIPSEHFKVSSNTSVVSSRELNVGNINVIKVYSNEFESGIKMPFYSKVKSGSGDFNIFSIFYTKIRL